MKKYFYVTILILFFSAGTILLIYPYLSDYLTNRNATQVINSYKYQVSSLSAEAKKTQMDIAQAYNRSLLNTEESFDHHEYQKNDLSNLEISGILGYIDVPPLNIFLPIYQGTNESNLKKGIGHLEGSSLPIPSGDSHSILTGHSALPNARLFTDLERMESGDFFHIHMLDEVFLYEVDQIMVVEPEETTQLEIIPGYDYTTLVTCTPYAVNSHRLLVRGRFADMKKLGNQSGEDSKPETWNRLFVTVLFVIVLIIIVLFFLIMLFRKFIKEIRRLYLK